MWLLMYVITGLLCAKSANAVPDIDNPTLQDALNEEGYEQIIKLTTEASGPLCQSIQYLEVNRSVLIKPEDHLSRAVLACPESKGNDDKVDKKYVIFTTHVTIINTDVTFMHFLIADRLVVTFVNCTFTNTDIWSRGIQSLHMQFVNTRFSGHVNSTCLDQPGCRTTSSVDAFGKNVTIWFKSCTFLQTYTEIRADYADKIHLENCTISNDESNVLIHRGIGIKVNGTTSDQPVTYIIKDSVIEKQIFRDPMVSAINLHFAVIIVDVQNQSLINLNITGCTFRENERALQLKGFPKRVNIVNCSFLGNEAMHSGAAILSQVGADTEILIKDSLFENNTAGSHELLRNPPDEGFSEDKYLIILNTTCCEGTIRLQGTGGAIALQTGKMTIEASRFINNSALTGGAIHSDAGTVLRLSGTYIECAAPHWKTRRSSALSSRGKTSIKKGVFNVTIKSGYSTIIYHIGGVQSLKLFDLYIQCPVGYDFRNSNSSSNIVAKSSIRRSFAFDMFHSTCSQRCDETYEGSDFGYFNYSIGGEKSMDEPHTTLLWTPNLQRTNTDQDRSTCYLNGGEATCPDGGYVDHHRINCSSRSLNARHAYYWYYQKRDSGLWTLECPFGYCESSIQETCAANRMGTLCGQCNSGFSQHYFHGECIQNDQCKPATFWITYILMGAAYVLLLIALAWLTLWASKERSRSFPDQRVKFSGQNVEVETVEEDTAELTGEGTVMPDKGSGFPHLDVIIILVYYFQDCELFHMANSYMARITSHEPVNAFLSLVFRFNWIIFSFGEDFCVVKGATAVINQVLAMVEIPKIMITFMIVVAIWHFIIRRKISTYRSAYESRSEQFDQLLWHGLFLTFLLAYQGHVLETVPLLKCVQFMDQRILVIQGTVDCTQPWQYILYLYLAFWLAPFFLVLSFGGHLLIREEITLTKFILLCLVPFPAFLYLVTQIMISKLRGTSNIKNNAENIKAQNVIRRFFQNSQTNTTKLPFLFDLFCCHGIIIMLRFAMVMVYTFNDDVMNGIAGMLLVVFVKLVYTSLALPYSTLRSNWLSVTMDAALLVAGGTNMAAGFMYRAGVYKGHFQATLWILLHTEATLRVWFPVCVALVHVIVTLVNRYKK